MTKMILVLNEQEKITLKRCLSLFIEQAKEKLIVADQVEIQTAQQMMKTQVQVMQIRLLLQLGRPAAILK